MDEAAYQVGSGSAWIHRRNWLVRAGREAVERFRTRPLDAASVHAQFDRILGALGEKLPKAAEHLDGARADVLGFTAFPKEVWRQIWSNNPRVILSQLWATNP